jgi:hypothetical protein
MAITQSLTVRGILLPEAYIRIDRLTGGKAAGFQAEAGLYARQDVSLPLDTACQNQPVVASPGPRRSRRLEA